MFEKTFNLMTYESQNIIMYCIVIPLMWCITLDFKIVRETKPFGFTVLYLFVIFMLSQFHDVLYYYDLLVKFLKYTSKYGYNYTKASIMFCIIYPLVITIFIMLLPTRKRNEHKTNKNRF